jgi:hypothetical protein
VIRTEATLKERELLRKCRCGDSAARTEFSVLSYRSEIFRAIRLRLRPEELDEKEIDSVAFVCIEWIFRHAEEVPSRLFDLHTVVRRIAYGFAKRYWAQRKNTLRRS